MLKKSLNILTMNFAKMLKVDVCGAWSFGRDISFLRRQMDIEDPDLKLEINRSKQSN